MKPEQHMEITNRMPRLCRTSLRLLPETWQARVYAEAALGRLHSKACSAGRDDPPRLTACCYSGCCFFFALLQLAAMTPIRREQKEGEDESGHAEAREHDLRCRVGSGCVAELAIEERE